MATQTLDRIAAVPFSAVAAPPTVKGGAAPFLEDEDDPLGQEDAEPDDLDVRVPAAGDDDDDDDNDGDDEAAEVESPRTGDDGE